MNPNNPLSEREKAAENQWAKQQVKKRKDINNNKRIYRERKERLY